MFFVRDLVLALLMLGCINISAANKRGSLTVLRNRPSKHLRVASTTTLPVATKHSKYCRYVAYGVGICGIGLLVTGCVSHKIPKIPIPRSVQCDVTSLAPFIKKVSWMISKKTVGVGLIWLGYCIGSRSNSVPYFTQKILGETNVQKKSRKWQQSLQQEKSKSEKDTVIKKRTLADLYTNINGLSQTSHMLEDQRNKRNEAIKKVCDQVKLAENSASQLGATIDSISQQVLPTFMGEK